MLQHFPNSRNTTQPQSHETENVMSALGSRLTLNRAPKSLKPSITTTQFRAFGSALSACRLGLAPPLTTRLATTRCATRTSTAGATTL